DERYLQAQLKRNKLLKEKQAAAARLRKVQKRMNVVQRHLNVRAHGMYRTGQMGFVEVLLGAESFEEFASTWDLLRDLNEEDASSIGELKDLRVKAKREHRTLTAKEKAAAGQEAAMKANRAQISAQLNERKRKLAGLESEIAQLEAAERRARAARAASYVRTAAPAERNFPAPTRAARSEVVAIAKRYLGAPYVWAAAGPNSFDCSGFTMFVYRQVGVSLPHSSRAQIGYGERVSRANLQPGDLVFFGAPIHHVGIYVGGGMMIHAPHTGAVVRIDPLHSNYSGACRP
ncbi:MAG TPA: NlpC/P60 family protein, partial [Coriobacteriia bacterium]|nr:NlpC/P60 family protein [Coriobacteriia bacterium]